MRELEQFKSQLKLRFDESPTTVLFRVHDSNKFRIQAVRSAVVRRSIPGQALLRKCDPTRPRTSARTFSVLIRLASDQPEQVATNVKI